MRRGCPSCSPNQSPVEADPGPSPALPSEVCLLRPGGGGESSTKEGLSLGTWLPWGQWRSLAHGQGPSPGCLYPPWRLWGKAQAGSGRTGQRLRAQMTTADDEDGEDNDLAATGSGLICWGGVSRGSHPGRLLMASDTVRCVSLGRVFIRSAPHF